MRIIKYIFICSLIFLLSVFPELFLFADNFGKTDIVSYPYPLLGRWTYTFQDKDIITFKKKMLPQKGKLENEFDKLDRQMDDPVIEPVVMLRCTYLFHKNGIWRVRAEFSDGGIHRMKGKYIIRDDLHKPFKIDLITESHTNIHLVGEYRTIFLIKDNFLVLEPVTTFKHRPMTFSDNVLILKREITTLKKK